MNLIGLITLYGDIVGVIEEVENSPSFEKFGETMLLLNARCASII